MPRWVKALAAKPNKQFDSQEPYLEEENQLLQVLSPARTYIHKLINKTVCSVTHSFPSSQNWKWNSPLVPLTLPHPSVAFLSLMAFQVV